MCQGPLADYSRQQQADLGDTTPPVIKRSISNNRKRSFSLLFHSLISHLRTKGSFYNPSESFVRFARQMFSLVITQKDTQIQVHTLCLLFGWIVLSEILIPPLLRQNIRTLTICVCPSGNVSFLISSFFSFVLCLWCLVFPRKAEKIICCCIQIPCLSTRTSHIRIRSHFNTRICLSVCRHVCPDVNLFDSLLSVYGFWLIEHPRRRRTVLQNRV